MARHQTIEERAQECQAEFEFFMERQGAHYLQVLEACGDDQALKTAMGEIFAAGYQLAIEACNGRLRTLRNRGEILVQNPDRYEQLHLAIAIAE